MINKESKKKDFYSDEWYRGIVKVNFVPLTIAKRITLKKKAGVTYPWKLFWLIPLFNVKCTENLYDLEHHTGLFTANEIKERTYHITFIDGIAYNQAYVRVSTKTDARTEYFDNDDDAIAFVDEVTEKAKKLKNAIS